MDYLITGATGFIGKKIVSALLERGHTVHYLARQRGNGMDERAIFYRWKGAEEDPPLANIPSLDAVIHLMGENVAQRWTKKAKAKIHGSRVDGTKRLVAAIGALSNKPRVLVSSSAVGFYGERGDELLTEDSPPGSGFLAEVCVDWEREALQARAFGVRVVTIRTAVVLGCEGGALPKMLTPFRLGLGGRLGTGKQWMSWIHVDDLGRLYLHAAESELAQGAWNGASPNPVRNIDFTRELGHAVGRPAVIPVPAFVLRVALGEMSAFLFDSIRAVPKAPLAAGFHFQYETLIQALSALLNK